MGRHNIALPGASEFVCVKTFWFPDEATLACTALNSVGILNYLQNDRMLNCVWAWNVALGGIRLMVPAKSAAIAIGVLEMREPEFVDSRSPMEDFDSTSDEPGRYRAWTRVVLGLCVFLSPTISSLSILVIYRLPNS